MRFAADVCGGIHGVKLGGGLEEPQFVQPARWVDDLAGGHHTGPNLRAHRVESTKHLSIEVLVLRQPVVKALYISEILRQARCQLVDWVGGVRPDDVSCTVDTRTWTFPNLTLFVVLAGEDHAPMLAVLRRQHEHTVRLVEAREVIEVTALSIRRDIDVSR